MIRNPQSAIRGYVLLETVIATGILVVGLAVIGAQVRDAFFAAKDMDLQVRALMLAESKLAELDTGLLEWETVDEVMEEEFGPLFPNYGWRISIEPTATEGLNLLTLDVFYKVRLREQEDFDFDKAKLLYSLHTFRKVPEPLDLAVDFGMEEEQLEQLQEAGNEAGLPIDVTAWDPRMFANAEIESLLRFLPTLLKTMGFTLGDVQNLPPELQQALRELLQGEGGRGMFGDETGDENGDETGDGEESEE